MRIISGFARGRTLIAPRGMETRPTQAKVRESLFNILRPRIADAEVLDIFSGSGALAIEALSQGASRAVLVDNARSAQDAIRQNLCALKLEGVAELLPCDWRQALKRLEGRTFDLIFLDPPYRMENLSEPLLPLIPLLAPRGLIVFEHASKFPPTAPFGLHIRDVRTYSDTAVTFFEKESEIP